MTTESSVWVSDVDSRTKVHSAAYSVNRKPRMAPLQELRNTQNLAKRTTKTVVFIYTQELIGDE